MPPASGIAALSLFAFLAFHVLSAADPVVSSIPLPPLRIDGKAARAHTQGLEQIGDDFIVTARREDVSPRRALLLRTRPGRTDWDVWDITPEPPGEDRRPLDHPGGFQSDGSRLWIPIAQSVRGGRSRIRVYPVAQLKAGTAPVPDLDFAVNDHVGALAVSRAGGQVIGASWDTEKVYVWDLEGRLLQVLAAAELRQRGLGVGAGADAQPGLTVQDWKFDGPRLIASGLQKNPTGAQPIPRSGLIVFERFLEANVRSEAFILPRQGAVELAHEAMAVAGGSLLFLPEDLGASNRLFQVSRPEMDSTQRSP